MKIAGHKVEWMYDIYEGGGRTNRYRNSISKNHRMHHRVNGKR